MHLNQPETQQTLATSTTGGKRVHYPALDGVRGMAVFLVLLSHTATLIAGGSGLEYAIKKTVTPLWFGVNIFFVLSGFLITGILSDSRRSGRYFRSFYIRRLLRIFPLYFGVLSVTFLVLPTMGLLDHTPFSGQVPYWTYLYNWKAISGYQAYGLGHFWTLAIEEQFYTVWPFVVLLTPGRLLWRVCLWGVFLSFCFRLSVLGSGLSLRYDYFATPAQMGDLCLGSAAACILRDRKLLVWFHRYGRAAAGFALGLAAVAAIVGHGFESNKSPVLVFGATGIALASACLILWAATSTLPRIWRGVLNHAWLKWLGRYSYGIYVYHIPIRDLLQKYSIHSTSTSGIVQCSIWLTEATVLLICSCLTAYLSYELYESKFLAMNAVVQNKVGRLLPSLPEQCVLGGYPSGSLAPLGQVAERSATE